MDENESSSLSVSSTYALIVKTVAHAFGRGEEVGSIPLESSTIYGTQLRSGWFSKNLSKWVRILRAVQQWTVSSMASIRLLTERK